MLGTWVIAPILFNMVFSLLSLLGLASFFAGPCKRQRLAFWIFLIGFSPISAAVLIDPTVPFWSYLALASANLAATYVFGHRVIQGRSLLLAHFVEAAHEGPPLSSMFLRYLKRQCLVWTGIGIITVGFSVTALVSSETRSVINHILLAVLAFQVIWFCTSHLLAQIWYGHLERWQVTLLHMMWRETWSKLKI